MTLGVEMKIIGWVYKNRNYTSIAPQERDVRSTATSLKRAPQKMYTVKNGEKIRKWN